MSAIHLLSDDLINKIAAGEVIERPASVVKELVENSLDAGATRIEIEIENGGKKLIRVTDNGAGMTAEDLPLAVLRHSTSKLKTLEDLYGLQTLGFRGEALPSIASVSKLHVVTRPHSEKTASEISIDNGKSGKVASAAGAEGTTVTVQNLFKNLPARRKFLKSDVTELSQITDLVTRFILLKPGVFFNFIHNGKTLLTAPGSGKLEDAVRAVYGLEIASQLIKIEFNQDNLRVSGLVSGPHYHRAQRSAESFFVNGRWIRNFLLGRELENAYAAVIPKGRYPLGVLFIELDGREVDINIHPAKREVKFSRTDQVLAALHAAVTDTLRAPLGSQAAAKQETTGVPLPTNFAAPNPVMFGGATAAFAGKVVEVASVLPVLPLYQFKNTFIVATDGEKLVIIDQHAAHERILYEKLKAAVNRSGSGLASAPGQASRF